METCKIANLYNLDETIAKDLFEGAVYPWEVLPKISAFIMTLGNTLSEEEYEKGGTFICMDGKLEYVMDNESDEVAIYELNKYDAFKIQNMSLVDPAATNMDDVSLNLEPLGTAQNGLYFIVYDNIGKTVIDKRGYY